MVGGTHANATAIASLLRPLASCALGLDHVAADSSHHILGRASVKALKFSLRLRGLYDVVCVLIGVDAGCIRESLADSAEPVANLESVAQSGRLTGSGALGNSKHTHAIEEL
ncbi:TPA: hypothetical protein NJT28_001864 [Corynebacterium striatum]|nr:hypothetical protein [Corynebacterium striatum]HCG2963184.1 hypothetical protein [Corynebacterium striatum]